MNNIDYIYYSATTTDSVGLVTGNTTSSYFVPFLDFLMVFLVLLLSIISVVVFDYFCYHKRYNIKVKNNIKVSRNL